NPLWKLENEESYLSLPPQVNLKKKKVVLWIKKKFWIIMMVL
ncbi:hypothetical protein LCGC14_3062520, partial [marine sediment metagenome]